MDNPIAVYRAAELAQDRALLSCAMQWKRINVF